MGPIQERQQLRKHFLLLKKADFQEKNDFFFLKRSQCAKCFGISGLIDKV